MLEVWKSIAGYEDYQVSNLGRVKSFCKNKPFILSAGKSRIGYYTVCLHKNKKPLSHNVHRLVAQAFIDNPLNKRYVNHIVTGKQIGRAHV